jgi:hypothetical protein
MEKPLSLYIFSENKKARDTIIQVGGQARWGWVGISIFKIETS